MTIPTKEELQKSWEELKEIHEDLLEDKGIKLPKGEEFDKSNKSVWLSVLYLHKDRYVHKNEISTITQHYRANAGGDQQVRHLKRDGWFIGDEPGRHKLDVTKVSPEFVSSSKLKNARLKAEDFEGIKQAYGNRCATCGAKEGETSRRYGDKPIKLQQAHMEPSKSGKDIRNIIPQCQYCNQAYLNDFTFDDKGRVRAIASVEPVKRATKPVQEKVFSWLKSNEDKNETEK